MPDESKTKDSRDRSKPDKPEGAVPENDQRRFRGQNKADPGTAADGRRGKVGGEETSEDAPMDAEDEKFLKSR